jgi:hypothetical protein
MFAKGRIIKNENICIDSLICARLAIENKLHSCGGGKAQKALAA